MPISDDVFLAHQGLSLFSLFFLRLTSSNYVFTVPEEPTSHVSATSGMIHHISQSLRNTETHAQRGAQLAGVSGAETRHMNVCLIVANLADCVAEVCVEDVGRGIATLKNRFGR